MLTKRIWPYRAEIAFWLLWLGAVAAVVGLAVWADRRYMLPLDRRITFGVQELYRYAWAGRFFDTVNMLGSQRTITLVLFAAFALLLVRGLRFEALMIAGAGAVRFVQLGVRAVVHRPDGEFLALRANLDGLHQPAFYPDASGFPSGHVFGATIVYGLIFAYAPRALAYKPLAVLARAFCVFEVALIGPARMYAGAHWFSDVVGAMLIAGIYLALAWKLDGMISHIRALAVERDRAAGAGLSTAPPRRRRVTSERPGASRRVDEPLRDPARAAR